MYRDALSRGTENSDIYSKIAVAHMRMHAYKEAATFYAKAVAKAPADVALRQQKAQLFIRMQQLDMAEKELREGDNWLKVRFAVRRKLDVSNSG